MPYPTWVGERRFVVLSDRKPVAAFYVRELAERFAKKRGLIVKDREDPG